MLTLDSSDSRPEALEPKVSRVYMFVCMCVVGHIFCDLAGVHYGNIGTNPILELCVCDKNRPYICMCQ